MTRRGLLSTRFGALAATSIHQADTPQPFPLRFNTYCLRVLRWTDTQLLNYAVEQKPAF